MLIDSVVAEAFATNCYLVAPDSGAQCLLIDPGFGTEEQVVEKCASLGLAPAAILLTHGHLDHTFAAPALSARFDIPVYIHAGDAFQLDDPVSGLGPLGSLVAGLEWTAPQRVHQVADGEVLSVAGLSVTAQHAPGHTAGSTLYWFPGDDAAAGYCFTGDVLFAGSIGRTDLPSASHEQMQRTLREIFMPMDGDVVVLPGHGGRSTMTRERAANPFLVGLADHSGGH